MQDIKINPALVALLIPVVGLIYTNGYFVSFRALFLENQGSSAQFIVFNDHYAVIANEILRIFCTILTGIAGYYFGFLWAKDIKNDYKRIFIGMIIMLSTIFVYVIISTDFKISDIEYYTGNYSNENRYKAFYVGFIVLFSSLFLRFIKDKNLLRTVFFCNFVAIGVFFVGFLSGTIEAGKFLNQTKQFEISMNDQDSFYCMNLLYLSEGVVCRTTSGEFTFIHGSNIHSIGWSL